MDQSVIGRVRNRIVNRYERGSAADCCDTAVEEAPPDAAEAQSEENTE